MANVAYRERQKKELPESIIAYDYSKDIQRQISNNIARISKKRRYTNPEEMERDIELFFESVPDNKLNISNLCLFLGFNDMEALTNYSKFGAQYAEPIKRAKLRITAHYEELMQTAKNQIAIIFALKNLGWKDNQTITVENLNPESAQAITLRVSDSEERLQAAEEKYLQLAETVTTAMTRRIPATSVLCAVLNCTPAEAQVILDAHPTAVRDVSLSEIAKGGIGE